MLNMTSSLLTMLLRLSALLLIIFIIGLSSKRVLSLSSSSSMPSLTKPGSSQIGGASKWSATSALGLSRRSSRRHTMKARSPSHISHISPTVEAPLDGTTKQSSKIPIYLVVLLPKSSQFLFSIERVSPAIALATDNVTSEQMLTRHRLVTLYADSRCHIAEAMNEAIKFYIQDIDAKECLRLMQNIRSRTHIGQGISTHLRDRPCSLLATGNLASTDMIDDSSEVGVVSACEAGNFQSPLNESELGHGYTRCIQALELN